MKPLNSDRELRARLDRLLGTPRRPTAATAQSTDAELRARIARLQDEHLVDQMARLVGPVEGARLHLRLHDVRAGATRQRRSEALVTARQLAQSAWSATRG